MRIGLVDVDGHNFPNLPLMKLSAYHKSIGDGVEWYKSDTGHFDIVYLSKVFCFTADYAEPINADFISKSGTGYAISLNNGKEVYNEDKDPALLPDMECMYPDYELYSITDTAYGFLTRGCPRNCAFCHVTAKEGTKCHKVANLDEFWHGQAKIVLLDPNLLACPDCNDLLSQLADSGAKVDITQGFDARLLTDDKYERISRINIQAAHFAWDKVEDESIIIPKLKLFRQATKLTRSNLIVYVLCNFDSTLEQDLHRIYTLRDIGYSPYVMLYDKEHIPKNGIYRKLQRWVNSKQIFRTVKRFENYAG